MANLLSEPEKQTLIIESHYWPSIVYLGLCLNAKNIQIEVWENYQKQSCRNRCRIVSAQKPIDLVVPVVKPKSETARKMQCIEIDYSQNWQKIHLRSIQTCYGKSIYFEHYFPEIQNFYNQKYKYLIDLNHEILTFCLKPTSYMPVLSDTLSYQTFQSYQSDIIDMRNRLEPDKLPDFYSKIYYGQVFETIFEQNTSFLDLLFCKGPFAIGIASGSVDFNKIF